MEEHYIYLIRNFFSDEKIFLNYVISGNVEKNYNILTMNCDIEAINKFVSTVDTLHNYININKDLEYLITNDIPGDFNKLEKAIYIYIKMCKIFSYDEQYFCFNQEGAVQLKHQDISHIMNIDLDNRELVCFEFNIIYCYFLNKLGINFKSNYRKCNNENYGKCHVNVDYRCDKYLIHADSLLSVIRSDLYYAKVNKKLRGIRCLNINKKTNEEFEAILNKVYQRIYDKEDKIESLNKCDIIDKLKYIYGKLSTKKFSNMDYISCFMDLYHNIFNEDERENKIKVSLAKNVNKVNIIVTISVDRINMMNENIYFVLIPNSGVQQINLGELQQMFDANILEYIEDDREKIPGIVLGNDGFKSFIKRFK